MALPGLSFSPGLRFQDELRASHGLPISSLSDHFALVVAFGRCKFKLSPLSVGRILQATIGGNASCFRVSSLGDRVFKFLVASKEVGLIIRRLGSFENDLFKMFFFLWGGGGPDWRLEYKKFLVEEDNLWNSAPTSRSQPRSFADVVRRPPATSVFCPPLSGANAIPLGNAKRKSVHSRLVFPSTSSPVQHPPSRHQAPLRSDQ